MLWGPGDGSQPVNTAAVTLSLSGEPSTVVFRSNRDPSCPSSLEFSDARLRLQTSDGTFDEVATGRLEGQLTEDAPIRFSGSLSLPFHGSYDSGPLTNYLEQPQFQVWHDEPSGSGSIRAEGQNFQSPELGHRIATVAWWSRQLNGLGAGGSGGGSSEPAADGYGDGGWANADREIRARAGSGGVRVDW